MPKPLRPGEVRTEVKRTKPPPPYSYDEDGHRIMPQSASGMLYAQRRVDLVASLLPQTLGSGPEEPRLAGDPAFVWSSENWQRGRPTTSSTIHERYKATIHELPLDSKLQDQFGYNVPSAVPPPGSPRLRSRVASGASSPALSRAMSPDVRARARPELPTPSGATSSQCRSPAPRTVPHCRAPLTPAGVVPGGGRGAAARAVL